MISYYKLVLAASLVLANCSRVVAPKVGEKSPSPPVVSGDLSEAERFQASIREEATFFDTQDYRQLTDRDLKALEKAIEGKRVVFLGEGDHYIHERYEYQERLIRFLHKHGFNYIVREVGRSDGHRINKFIEAKDPQYLDRVALLGYRGLWRPETDENGFRKKLLERARLHTTPESISFGLAFLNEEKRFLGSLADLGAIHYSGWDIDVIPGGGYEDIASQLAPFTSNSAVTKVLDRVARPSNESDEQEIKRLSSVLDFVDERTRELNGILGLESTRELYNAILTLRQSLKFAAGLVGFVSTGAIDPSQAWASYVALMTERETKTAFRQWDELWAKLRPDDKVILIGHNLHLAKNYRSVYEGEVGETSVWPMLGTHIAESIPGKTLSIWMLYDHGKIGNPNADGTIVDVKSNSETVEHLMAQTTSNGFITVLSAPQKTFLSKIRKFVLNGQPNRAILADQLDAVFFIPEVSPLRRPQ